MQVFKPSDVLRPFNEVERRNAPEVLHLEGDVGLLRGGARVAVVGSRKATDFGKRRAARLCRYLVERGVTVVSGLAMGIDTVAHETTIRAGGRTIAVLGTPLDQYHPASNRKLQETIGTDHLLVSQFPSGHPVRRSNFPRRNRTMALLCDATVIVEAGESSGTLSQGWEALRLGRPLFLMRSLVEESDLEWPQEMLRYGAHILREPADLFAEIFWEGDEASVVF
jgi:DNA processing protein